MPLSDEHVFVITNSWLWLRKEMHTIPPTYMHSWPRKIYSCFVRTTCRIINGMLSMELKPLLKVKCIIFCDIFFCNLTKVIRCSFRCLYRLSLYSNFFLGEVYIKGLYWGNFLLKHNHYCCNWYVCESSFW